jgi:hypothetical protein
LIQVAQAYSDAKKAGLLTEVPTEKYEVGRANNLRAIQKALAQAADSDGKYPEAAKWMESAQIRLKTSDLSEAEAQLKLKVPGSAVGFGYAFNDAVGGKSPDAWKAKGTTIIVYESLQTGWDAHGDPSKDGKKGGKAVTVAGDVVDLKP